MSPYRQSTEQIRSEFLNTAGVVQGGCVLFALILAYALDVPLWPQLYVNGPSVLWGTVMMAPMLFCLILDRLPIPGMKDLSDQVLITIGEKIAACRWYDLVILSGLAGLGEEMLFRGVIQSFVTDWFNPLAGIVVSAALFGLVHAVTPMYVIVTFTMGLYLSFVMTLVSPPNLLVPILAHALYDLIAFNEVRREYRSRQLAGTLPSSHSVFESEDPHIEADELTEQEQDALDAVTIDSEVIDSDVLDTEANDETSGDDATADDLVEQSAAERTETDAASTAEEQNRTKEA